MMFDNPITNHAATGPAWDPSFAMMDKPAKPAIPLCGAHITTAWLNQALAPHLESYAVIGCQAKPHDVPGQTADIVELWLHYDRAQCPLPARMIAKLGAADPTTRELARTFRLYERETAFYGSVSGDDLPIARQTVPPLTTVRQDIAGGARGLVQLLLRRLAGEETESLVMPPQLVIRHSA